MRLPGWILAAALAVSGVLASAPVAAQPARVRVVETTRVHYERDRGWDRGRYWGRGKWRWRTVCRTQWRYGHRQRVCRKVRYRR